MRARAGAADRKSQERRRCEGRPHAPAAVGCATFGQGSSDDILRGGGIGRRQAASDEERREAIREGGGRTTTGGGATLGRTLVAPSRGVDLLLLPRLSPLLPLGLLLLTPCLFLLPPRPVALPQPAGRPESGAGAAGHARHDRLMDEVELRRRDPPRMPQARVGLAVAAGRVGRRRGFQRGLPFERKKDVRHARVQEGDGQLPGVSRGQEGRVSRWPARGAVATRIDEARRTGPYMRESLDSFSLSPSTQTWPFSSFTYFCGYG